MKETSKKNLRRISEMYNKEKGITLIALVITIVILIILATVTLNVVLGEGGLIARAQLAKDMTLNATAEEERALNELYGMLSSEDSEIKQMMRVKEKTETTITVEAAEGYTNYQFSIDGKNWTEAQESNIYTFTNLEKTVVNKSNYEDIKGKEYTIYGKGEKDNKEKEFQEISTKLNVEVEVPEIEYYFTYRDLGEEIEITGRRDLIELVTEEGTSIPENEDTIMIPSYINGKPVTKVNAELLKSIHIGTCRVDGLFVSKEANSEEYKQISGFASDEDGGVQCQITYSNVSESVNTFKAIATARKMIGFGELIDIDGYNLLELQVKPFENIVIPPTVKEITSDLNMSNLISKNTEANAKELSNIEYLRREVDDSEDPEPDNPEPPDLSGSFTLAVKAKYMEGNKLTTNETWGYTPVHVKILGKENKEEINNILYANEINKQNGESEGEQYEPDGNIPEYKIDYVCIY